MLQRIALSAALAVAGFGFYGLSDAAAQNENTAGQSKLSTADRHFMDEAARSGIAEVQLSQMAANHYGSDDVVKYSQQLIRDHGQIDNELKQLADKKGITLPQEMDAKDKAFRDHLLQVSSRSGYEFDRDYLGRMVKDHEDAVALFQREANNGKDPDVKTWAGKTLPTLQGHLQQAKTLEDELHKKQTAKR